MFAVASCACRMFIGNFKGPRSEIFRSRYVPGRVVDDKHKTQAPHTISAQDEVAEGAAREGLWSRGRGAVAEDQVGCESEIRLELGQHAVCASSMLVQSFRLRRHACHSHFFSSERRPLHGRNGKHPEEIFCHIYL